LGPALVAVAVASGLCTAACGGATRDSGSLPHGDGGIPAPHVDGGVGPFPPVEPDASTGPVTRTPEAGLHGRAYETYTTTSPGAVCGLVGGPDGNVWFTLCTGNAIGRISEAGQSTRFPLPSYDPGPSVVGYGPVTIIAGGDGALWFTQSSTQAVGRITTSGAVTTFALSSAANAGKLAWGPDGNLWFTEVEGSKIGFMTPAGAVKELDVGGYDPNDPRSGMGGIAGAKDAVWFTQPRQNLIVRITSSGVTKPFAVPAPDSYPTAIVADAGGNLWFLEEDGNALGRLTPLGDFTEYPLRMPYSDPRSLAIGKNATVWFTEPGSNQLGRVDLETSALTEFAPPLSPMDLALASDGSVWFTSNSESSGDVMDIRHLLF
jgi:virginiamycin B lyase